MQVLKKDIVEAVLGEIVAGFVSHEGLSVSPAESESLIEVILVVRGNVGETEGETRSHMDNCQVVIFFGEHIRELVAQMTLVKLIVGELYQTHRIGRVAFAHK